VTTSTHADLGGFVHPALFYRSRREYLDCLVPFIVQGLARAYPMLVALPEPNLAAVRAALGETADGLTMVDMTRVGRNPGRILGGVLSSFVDKHPGRPVRIIGEPIWSSRSELEYPACVQHEALINKAFAGRDDVTVLCPYDESQLEPAVLADARMTHPLLWQAGSKGHSCRYAPDAVLARYNEPLSSSPTAVGYAVRAAADLAGLRVFTAAYAKWFGLPPGRIADLQLIATELATSSLARGDTKCRIALWHHDGRLVCEARDDGYLDDRLAGRRPYYRQSSWGRGLFLGNAVAGLVRTDTTPEATTVRAYLASDAAA
jgi:anti-sigma regulatory factor (Ser/Thr protein kinase)